MGKMTFSTGVTLGEPHLYPHLQKPYFSKTAQCLPVTTAPCPCAFPIIEGIRPDRKDRNDRKAQISGNKYLSPRKNISQRLVKSLKLLDSLRTAPPHLFPEKILTLQTLPHMDDILVVSPMVPVPLVSMGSC